MTANEASKMERFARVSMVFTPSAPIDNRALFTDRPEQVFRCIGALFQKGLHVALYGERGVGKTSIAAVLPQIIKGTELPTLDAVRVVCNTTDDFQAIWRTVFRELGRPLDDDATVGPEDVRYHLQRLERRTMIVLDELDRVQDDTALSLLADTVKALSDHAVEATLMFVGVARSVEHLIGEHASVVRSLSQVPVPRMSEKELNAILSNGFAKLEMQIAPRAATHIVTLAEGLPHFVHLLAQQSAKRVIADDREQVDLSDVERALEETVETHSLMSEYHAATSSPQPGHLYEEVLLACAFAPRNDLSQFRPGDVKKPLSRIMARDMDIPNYQRHINEFSSTRRGMVLQKDGLSRYFTYRFANPLMQPFVKIRALARGLISEEDREALQTEQDGAARPTPDGWTTEPGQLF